MDLGLQNVHVLVTGASGGIGLDTSRVFLLQGARVTLHYNTNSLSIRPLLEEFGPERVRSIQADLSKEENAIRMFATESSFGPVQVLIVNNGKYRPKLVPVVDLSLDAWKSTVDSNLTSFFLASREYLRQLRSAGDELKEKAAIVFIGSTAGVFGEAGGSDYAASKSGIMYGLTLSLKNEIVQIAPKGRVNCIAPGWVHTPMASEALKNPKTVYAALATTPLKKVAMPMDIASQIVIMSSSVVSGHVNGQVVVVSGGMEGRLLNYPEDIALS